MPVLQVIDGILGLKPVKWGLLILTILFLGVSAAQTLRLRLTTADLKVSQAELSKRDSLIEEIGLRTKEFEAKMAHANKAATLLQTEHQKERLAWAAKKFPSDCQAAADMAVEELPGILEDFK